MPTDPSRNPSPPIAVAAVLLFSKDPANLARFYRDLVGVPLRQVSLQDVPIHWACDIQHVYLSIWPADSPESRSGNGVALYVRDVSREYERLVAEGVPSDFAPTKTAMGIIARMRDPDGNVLELYQPLRAGQ